MDQNELENRLIGFATRVIKPTKALPLEFASQHISKQMIRSAKSAALNYGEVREAESTKDFIHKMKICLKELRETIICLKIILNMHWIEEDRLISIMN